MKKTLPDGSIIEGTPDELRDYESPYTNLKPIVKSTVVKKYPRVRKNTWTDEEETLLNELFYKGKRDKQIARKLHRSAEAVKTHRYTLGLVRRKRTHVHVLSSND